MNIEINQKAPVVSKKTITIFAPADVVWDLLTGINNWPDWQQNVKEATLEEPLHEGARFRWKAGGVSLISRIHTVKPVSEFGWTGKTLGASAIHNWWIEESGDAVNLRVEESLGGMLPSLLKSFFQKNLEEGMQTQLVELKLASEAKYEKQVASLNK